MIFHPPKYKPKKKRKIKGEVAQKYKTTFVEKKPSTPDKYRAAGTEQYKSLIDTYLETHAPAAAVTQVQYEGEMAEREAAARAELERKKGRVAPLFNKGAYQLITDESQLKDIGRK